MTAFIQWAAIFLCLMSQASGAPRPEVVHIVSREIKSGKSINSIGSGVLVEKEIVLTAWHVVRDNPRAVEIHYFDGTQSVGEFVAGDAEWDIAAIRVSPDHGIQPAPLGLSNPKPRELLTIAGYGGPNPVYREDTGPVTMYLSPVGLGINEFVELRATARDGDSGGPIFNQRGHVVGVLFGCSDGKTSGACCMRLREFLERKSVRCRLVK
jgi:serine protease Do